MYNSGLALDAIITIQYFFRRYLKRNRKHVKVARLSRQTLLHSRRDPREDPIQSKPTSCRDLIQADGYHELLTPRS